MATKRAEDIMIPLDKYPHIPHWFTLRQAVAEIQKSKIDFKGHKSLPRALLVFDEKYHLLGIVRRRDILRGLEPKFLKTMPMTHRQQMFDIEADPDLTVLTSGKVAKAVKDQADNTISEVMQPVAGSVRHDDHITKIIYKMIHKDLNLLPVVRGDKVIGVVRSVDAFNEMANILLG